MRRGKGTGRAHHNSIADGCEAFGAVAKLCSIINLMLVKLAIFMSSTDNSFKGSCTKFFEPNCPNKLSRQRLRPFPD